MWQSLMKRRRLSGWCITAGKMSFHWEAWFPCKWATQCCSSPIDLAPQRSCLFIGLGLSVNRKRDVRYHASVSGLLWTSLILHQKFVTTHNVGVEVYTYHAIQGLFSFAIVGFAIWGILYVPIPDCTSRVDKFTLEQAKSGIPDSKPVVFLGYPFSTWRRNWLHSNSAGNTTISNGVTR